LDAVQYSEEAFRLIEVNLDQLVAKQRRISLLQKILKHSLENSEITELEVYDITMLALT
jgi:hypothetical protein